MRRRKLLHSRVAVFTATVCLALVFLGCRDNTPAPQPAERFAALTADVQRGMTRSEVSRLLDEAGLEYSFNEETDRLYAIQRNVVQRGLVSESRQLIIDFDAEDHVTNTEVRSVYTGP